MRKVGAGLVAAAYGLLLFTSLGALHAGAHPHLGTAMRSEFAAAWPVALTSALSAAGIMLALIPIRRGERWALWTSLSTLIILLIPRMATDPRCWVVLDPRQHGCHTFMIAVVLGVVGLALAGFSRSPDGAGS